MTWALVAFSNRGLAEAVRPHGAEVQRGHGLRSSSCTGDKQPIWLISGQLVGSTAKAGSAMVLAFC